MHIKYTRNMLQTVNSIFGIVADNDRLNTKIELDGDKVLIAITVNGAKHTISGTHSRVRNEVVSLGGQPLTNIAEHTYTFTVAGGITFSFISHRDYYYRRDNLRFLRDFLNAYRKILRLDKEREFTDFLIACKEVKFRRKYNILTEEGRRQRQRERNLKKIAMRLEAKLQLEADRKTKELRVLSNLSRRGERNEKKNRNLSQ